MTVLKNRKPWVPLKAYAEYRGVSDRMVRKDIAKGRIHKKCVRKNGRAYEINVKGADASLGGSKKPQNSSAAGSVSQKDDQHQPKRSGTVTDEEKIKVIDASGIERCNSLNDAQKLNTEYQAANRKFKLEQERGEWVRADEVKAALIQHIKSAQTTLLGIKSELTPIVSEYLHDVSERESVLGIVDARIRQALEELSSNGL